MTNKRIIEFLTNIVQGVEFLEEDIAQGEKPNREISLAIRVFIDDLKDEEENNG